jgi:hypothetical protein
MSQKANLNTHSLLSHTKQQDIKEDQYEYCFELTVEKRTFVFCASSEEELKMWMDNIKLQKNLWWKSAREAGSVLAPSSGVNAAASGGGEGIAGEKGTVSFNKKGRCLSFYLFLDSQ